jgi:hypothetical protein
MLLNSLDGLIWLLCTLLPFLVIQRWVHREMQLLLLLVTRRIDLSLGIFALLFLPGVFLHEISHFLMAKLIRVRTGRFSLVPKPLPNDQIQMGFVETQKSDPLRSALIGMAPLLSGSIAVALLGIYQLGLSALIEFSNQGNWNAFWSAAFKLPQQPDFFIWFYLAFVISSTMLPSASDRMAWTPILIGVGILLTISLIAGGGPWMLAHFAPHVNSALKAVAIVFGISLTVHLVSGIPIRLLRELLSRIIQYP